MDEREEVALALIAHIDALCASQAGAPVAMASVLAGASGADYNARRAGLGALLEKELLLLDGEAVAVSALGQRYAAFAESAGNGQAPHDDGALHALRQAIRRDARFNPPPRRHAGVLPTEPAALEALLDPARRVPLTEPLPELKLFNGWMAAAAVLAVTGLLVVFQSWFAA
ncbi:MAG: hypothetical protein EOO25_19055 [Comamonadaceae bacterium]|nr:MAG: hypothetical protein EOO25_19055 [Comamonadaceae bacterium]